ncbi:MAG: hemolysin III family protein [Deltaproteobacteria bacterium]|nr:hemolysin III family protein [Deltaproteobacteria bacterium]
MTEETTPPRYTVGEEIANSITHGIGVLGAIAGLVVLIMLASRYGDVWRIAASAVFAASLVILYGASTLYHSISFPRAKKILRTIDHVAIYLLIAGTYTPFTLITLRGPWGWSLFGATWGLALLGILIQFTRLSRVRNLSLVLYLAMGWAVVAAIRPLIANLSGTALSLLIGGGMAYTVGTFFYVWRRIPFSHAIWHGFVLLGSTLHFFAVSLQVVRL